MTERLDRIEAILETTAQQQAKTSDEVDTLLGAVGTNEAAIRDLTANVNELVGESKDSQKRFEILRDEAQQDRAENRRNTDMLTANIQRLEQAISKLSDNVALMVAENRSQRETVNNLIKLCTALVERGAA